MLLDSFDWYAMPIDLKEMTSKVSDRAYKWKLYCTWESVRAEGVRLSDDSSAKLRIRFRLPE